MKPKDLFDIFGEEFFTIIIWVTIYYNQIVLSGLLLVLQFYLFPMRIPQIDPDSISLLWTTFKRRYKYNQRIILKYGFTKGMQKQKEKKPFKDVDGTVISYY